MSNSSIPGADPTVIRQLQNIIDGASISAQKKHLEDMVLADYSESPHLRAIQIMISSAWLMVSDLAKDVSAMVPKLRVPGYNKGSYVVDTINIETTAAFIISATSMARILAKELAVTDPKILAAIEAMGFIQEIATKEKAVFLTWLPLVIKINPHDPVDLVARR